MVFLLMQVNQLCIFIMEMLMYFISDYSNWTKQETQVKIFFCSLQMDALHCILCGDVCML